MGKPVRVAQVLNRMESGGIEAVVMNYYRHMDREKVQFDFYFFKESNFPQRQELERLGAGMYPIPAYSRLFAYHSALYRAFKNRRYKIVHAHLSTMSLFALFAAWRAGVPVRICHNHSTAHWSEGTKTLLKYLLRPFNKLFATHYFACGEKAGRWMYGDRCFDKGKVRVMPNAIETEAFAFDPAARLRLREELHIPEDAFVVGHVGRFTRAKNHHFLLSVFSELTRLHPNARLLLVGQGELKSEIEKEIGKYNLKDKVVFAGIRKDVCKLYSAMDSFCLPSLYEGAPVVALEAQANGLPCVLSDQITKEIVVNENVRSLELSQPDRWAEDLLEMHRNEDEMGIEAFHIEKQAHELALFYLGCNAE